MTREEEAMEQAFKMMRMQHVKAPRTDFDRRFIADWIEEDLLCRQIYGGREEVEGFINEFFPPTEAS